MARRIPWATGGDAVETVKPKPTPVQQKQHEQPVSTAEDLASIPRPHLTSSPMKLLSKVQVGKRETSRTPSPSPPPAPPQPELMHEGYHADDIFMMVEDEFQAVAQSFTHHLHHAEYVRLKRTARAAPPPAFAKALGGLHTETKRKLEAKEVHDRQTLAVKSMISRAGRFSPDNEEEAPDNDPWQGTSLAGLMSSDSTQKRTALVGLEKIPGATRAAKGFSRGEGDSPAKREDNRSILEIYGGKNRRRRTISPTPGALAEDDGETEDDDLDAPPRMKPTPKRASLASAEIQKPLAKKARVDPLQPRNSLIPWPSSPDSRSHDATKTKLGSHTSKPRSKLSSPLRKATDSFHDFHDEDSDEFSTRLKSIVSSTSKTRSKRERAKEKDKRSRLDEIPTFLV